MKIVCLIIASLVLSSITGCGQQGDSEETQSRIAKPKVDLHGAVLTNDLESILQHIKAGSDLNVAEATRRSSPLITAAYLGNTDAARILIDAGADLNYQNADGSTALHTATVFGRTETAKLLIEAGADLNIKNQTGSTALHSAAFFCREAIIKVLLENGADKSLRNDDGITALGIVEVPFEQVREIYDQVAEGLEPLGLQLDYERIEATRPRIIEMLK